MNHFPRIGRGILPRILLFVATFTAFQAFAQVPDDLFEEDLDVEVKAPIPDKMEGFNRAIFKFNDGFYRVILRPLSRGYKAIMPRFMRRSIGNVYHNLGYPTRLVGNLIEGDGRGMLKETGRFLVNSTAGVGGLMVPADDVPALKVAESDIGLGLATHGVGPGSYIVVPFIGPTSLRDGPGDLVSAIWLDPFHYIDDGDHSFEVGVGNIVNRSPELMQLYDNMKGAAIDPYIAFRDAWASRRAQQVRDQLAERTRGREPPPGEPTASDPAEPQPVR